MSQPELVKKLVAVLDASAIDYMITGSIASSLHGEIRLTHDIDIVLSIQESDIPVLIQAFPPPDFYLDEIAIIEAIRSEGMFNLLDINEGDKIDFWLLTNNDFDTSRFKRKIFVDFQSIKMKVSSPEDTILMKLRWAQLSGGSEKQLTDALRVYEVQYDTLDLEYIKNWINKLGVDELYQQLLSKIKL